jgi:hypothetical protein
MCTGVELALLAGSTALGAYNNRQSMDQQNRIAADAFKRNQALNQEAGKRVSDEIQRVTESGPQAEARDANADFMEALRRAKVEEGGDALTGRGSDRFADDLGLARTAAGAEGRKTAGILARIDAPQFQRAKEAAGVSRAATDLSVIGGRGQSGDFLDQLRLARARPDPALDALASFGSAYGMGRAGRMKRPPVGVNTSPSLVGAFDTSTLNPALTGGLA